LNAGQQGSGENPKKTVRKAKRNRSGHGRRPPAYLNAAQEGSEENLKKTVRKGRKNRSCHGRRPPADLNAWQQGSEENLNRGKQRKAGRAMVGVRPRI